MNEVSRRLKGNHALLMVICCVVPMALLAAVLLFNIPLGTVGFFAIMLACPLMHIFMMRGMGHGDQRAGSNSGVQGNAVGNAEAAAEPVATGRRSRLPSQTALTKSRYDRQARTYDRRMALMERLGFRRLRYKLWSLVSGRDILEVGIGTGSNMPFHPQGVHIIGIDLSDRMLAQARIRARRDAVPVQLLAMDAQNLSFPPATYDSVVSTCVFCSVPDPVQGLREVRRVLKPGGKLVMLEHVRGPGLLGPIFDLLNPVVVLLSGANVNRRTVANVEMAGFEIESVESHFFDVLKLIVARKRY